MKLGTRGTRRRCALLAMVTVLVVAATGCGDDAAESDQRSELTDAVDPTVVPSPGPVVLPPLDSPALERMPVNQVVTPAGVDEQLAQYGPFDEWNAGTVVLYGDPEAADPFEQPWVMAIVHQGSENSGISDGFDPRGSSADWRDVPAEQLNQEARQAALLSDGLDDASLDELVRAAEVANVDGQDRIEIGFVGLDAAPATLRLLTSGPARRRSTRRRGAGARTRTERAVGRPVGSGGDQVVDGHVLRPFGPYELCQHSLMVTYPDGTFDGGGMSSGGCSEAGSVGVVALRDRATLVHGEVPADAAAVRLTLDDEQVHEPELVGDGRTAFGFVVEGIRGVQTGEVLGADGAVLGALGEPLVGAPGSSTTQTFGTPT